MWLPGAFGDALHAVLCAAGYNLRWLIRALLSGRIKPLFCPSWIRARLAQWQVSTAEALLLQRFGRLELSLPPSAWECQMLPNVA